MRKLIYMRTLIFIIKLCLVICFISQAQAQVQRLDSVPEAFTERYKQEYHEYNPLHVGDIWQFVDYWGSYSQRLIVKDTTVNNKKYYKKVEEIFVYDPFYWERNDSSNRAAYRLDFQDLDEDGDSLDELLLDSLEVIDNTQYTSYRYTWKPWDPDPKTVLVFDSLWITVFGDTVIARLIEYIPPFQDELVADMYGVVGIYPEGSPPLLLTGMIINGVKYGNIVGVAESSKSILSEYKLEDNFPNPFNPNTTIRFYLPEDTFVMLNVFNILGKKVQTLINEEKISGLHEIVFDGTGLPSGVFIYGLQTAKFYKTKKMILIR